MRYILLKADKAGESHFEHATLQLNEADYRPPAPLLFVSHTYQADDLQFIRLPSDWSGGIHPSTQTLISYLFERAPRSDG